MITCEEFVAELEQSIQTRFARLAQLSSAGEPSEDLTIDRLLIVALKNELEASEIAAIWLPDTKELSVKLALARQVGDEAKHYRLIEARLAELGVDTSKIDPRVGGYSPLFTYLRGLTDTTTRVAAGQFTREGMALVRNQCFIEFCEAREDPQTAALYRDIIQPDERHHHELGRSLLANFVSTDEERASAQEAAMLTLELAEEAQETARLKAGISRAPGC